MTKQFQFERAVKNKEKLRLALDGVTGGGKTWTSLTIGSFLAFKEGGKIAVIDSERSSAKKYASDFEFDHLTLPDYDPRTYTAAIKSAINAGYAVIIVDSLSHAWEGTLEMKDAEAARSRSHDSYIAWRKVTPVHNELIDTMLRAPAHVIVTMRSKMEYVHGQDDSGKTKVEKVGLKPQQREGVEYEFDIVGDMEPDNTLIVSKTRCSALNGKIFKRPGDDLAQVIWEWLNDGDEAWTPPPAVAPAAELPSVDNPQPHIGADAGKPTRPQLGLLRALCKETEIGILDLVARKVLDARIATSADLTFSEADTAIKYLNRVKAGEEPAAGEFKIEVTVADEESAADAVQRIFGPGEEPY